MSKPALLVTVNVSGAPRKLFSVKEKPSGALTILLKVDRYAMFPATPIPGIPQLKVEVQHEHISIHTTPESPTVTQIHKTREFKEKILDNSDWYHETTSLKAGDRFATVISRLSGPMNLDQHHLPSAEDRKAREKHSLGKLAPGTHSLIFSVLASERDLQLKSVAPARCCRQCERTRSKGVGKALYRSFAFARYRLTVIWTLLERPASINGSALTGTGAKGFGLRSVRVPPLEGEDAAGTWARFHHDCFQHEHAVESHAGRTPFRNDACDYSTVGLIGGLDVDVSPRQCTSAAVDENEPE